MKTYFDRLREDEEQAKIDYQRIIKEDENKNFMDILPSEFKNFKRSIIKRNILHYIDKVTKYLNESGIYDIKFTEKEVVRYMMTGTDYSNFYLAYMFIPHKDESSLWMNYIYKNREKNLDKKKLNGLRAKFEAENKEILKKYQELNHLLSGLSESWTQYKDRQKIREGKLVNDYDIEKDGFPRCGRGNMCYLFIPVKGHWPKDKKGTFKLKNPRNGKTFNYKIEKYKEEDNIYMCLNEDGKKVFLAVHDEINSCWDALFTVNKEIYSGWWNKTMISKEK